MDQRLFKTKHWLLESTFVSQKKLKGNFKETKVFSSTSNPPSVPFLCLHKTKKEKFESGVETNCHAVKELLWCSVKSDWESHSKFRHLLLISLFD